MQELTVSYTLQAALFGFVAVSHTINSSQHFTNVRKCTSSERNLRWMVTNSLHFMYFKHTPNFYIPILTAVSSFILNNFYFKKCSARNID